MTTEYSNSSLPLKIGTRGSPLALAQAHETRRHLMAAFDLPETAFEIVVIKTTGDKVQDRPLKDLGGKGLFTKEIEDDLMTGTIDIAVHSMKDMPVSQPTGLILDCYLEREDPRDGFITLDAGSFDELEMGAVVGTSSIRRRAQLLHRRPDLKVVEFRGNVQTRLRKLQDGVAQATFLAMAGLKRLGMDDLGSKPISPDQMLPAVAQGAIGIERRENDARAETMLAALHHHETGLRLAAERAFLTELDGSCQTPIAGLAEIDGDMLRLRGEILRTDGAQAIAGELTGSTTDGKNLGVALAQQLLAQAGDGFFDWR